MWQRGPGPLRNSRARTQMRYSTSKTNAKGWVHTSQDTYCRLRPPQSTVPVHNKGRPRVRRGRGEGGGCRGSVLAFEYRRIIFVIFLQASCDSQRLRSPLTSISPGLTLNRGPFPPRTIQPCRCVGFQSVVVCLGVAGACAVRPKLTSLWSAPSTTACRCLAPCCIISFNHTRARGGGRPGGSFVRPILIALRGDCFFCKQ